MRVSQRLDYALRALVALAGGPLDAPVAAGAVAVATGLPRRFVEQQFTSLARAGIVSCRRGAGGGCVLAREPGEVTVLDVVRALEGAALDVPHTSGSAVAEMWGKAAGALEAHLAGITLAELVERQRLLDADATTMYYI